MDQEPFITELNQKTNEKYKFSLKSATLNQDADFCVVEIFYNDGVKFEIGESQKLKDIAVNILPTGYKYEINFIKKYVSEDNVLAELKKFMSKSFPSIFYKIEDLKEEENTFNFKIKIDELSYEHSQEKNLALVLKNHFKSIFEDNDFEFKLCKDKIVEEKQEEINKNSFDDEPDMYEFRKIDVSEPEILVGEEIQEKPDYIKDKTKLSPNVTLCGRIKNIKEIVIKKKPKETNEETLEDEKEETNENPKEDSINDSNSEAENAEEKKQQRALGERKIFKWLLEDFTGSISCTMFSRKEIYPKLKTLGDGMSIIASGSIEEDKYTNDKVFMVKNLSLCKLPEKFDEFIIYHKEKPYYEFVKPEKVVMFKQDDLMSFMAPKSIPKYLQNKTFVCYDFETTGLHYETGDKIIEIGAVKIENGTITEKFMTYVDPECHISEGASSVNHIYDEDVAGAPKDYEALQDFYKFTRGAIIIGYNILAFDNVFLLGQGKSSRWDFSQNEYEDVYKFAQKNVHGVKNYKLKTIAEKLGVVLDNAHRAVYDAMATAEVFIKIAELME